MHANILPTHNYYYIYKFALMYVVSANFQQLTYIELRRALTAPSTYKQREIASSIQFARITVFFCKIVNCCGLRWWRN